MQQRGALRHAQSSQLVVEALVGQVRVILGEGEGRPAKTAVLIDRHLDVTTHQDGAGHVVEIGADIGIVTNAVHLTLGIGGAVVVDGVLENGDLVRVGIARRATVVAGLRGVVGVPGAADVDRAPHRGDAIHRRPVPDLVAPAVLRATEATTHCRPPPVCQIPAGDAGESIGQNLHLERTDLVVERAGQASLVGAERLACPTQVRIRTQSHLNRATDADGRQGVVGEGSVGLDIVIGAGSQHRARAIRRVAAVLEERYLVGISITVSA